MRFLLPWRVQPHRRGGREASMCTQRLQDLSSDEYRGEIQAAVKVCVFISHRGRGRLRWDLRDEWSGKGWLAKEQLMQRS